MSDDLVLAVNANGEKQYVPRHFITMSEAGTHGFDFRLAPSAKAEEEAKAAAEAEPPTPPPATVKKATTNKEGTNA